MDQRRAPEPEQTKHVDVPILIPHPQQPLRTDTITALRSTANIFFWSFVGIFVILVLLVSGLNISRDHEVLQLQQVGLMTQAIIVSRTPEDHGEDVVVYEFTATPLHGVRQKFRNTASISWLSADKTTSSITIVYDPANPQTSILKGTAEKGTDMVALILPFCFTGLFLLAGIFLMLIPLNRRIRSARSLDQYGTVVQGVVIERWYYRGKPSGNSIAFTFSVPQLDGGTRTIVGAQYIETSVLYKRLQIGATVKVRYLADNPAVYRLELPSGVF